MANDEKSVTETGDDEEEEVGRHLLQVRGETFRVTELGWRNLVFVPFNTYWLVVVTSATIFQQFMDSRHLVFKEPHNIAYLMGTLVVWIIFILDTVLSIIHRLWERVNRSRRFAPKSWFVILIDTICAHPTLLIYFLYFKSKMLSEFVKWFVVMVDLIRLYRVIVFYAFVKAKIGLNQVFVNITFYNLFVLILTDVFTVLWAIVDEYSSGTTLIRRYKSDPYLYSHMFQFHLLFGSAINEFVPGNELDVLLLMLPTVVWYCLNRIFVIVLLVDFLKRLNHHFNYRSTLEVAEIHLSNIGIKKKVREDFLNFYDTLWDLWWGISWEDSLDHLPLSMRKETYVDISWDAMQHSRTLRFQGINFKRDVALSIKSVMYRPKDYVFDYNDVKSTMLYLVSGTLQVMSVHDSTCPLLSFTRGTILGGGAVVLSFVSNLAVRSSSYSEMHVLGASELFDVALLYPWELRYMHLQTFDRLQDAYTMNKVERLFQARKKMYDEIFVEPDIKCITWMKRRWKLINSLDVSNIEEAKEVVKDIPVFEKFTSRYLDLYVISEDEDLELKKNRFCLEAMWPFVLEPECDFLKFWNSFILLLVCVDCIILPYYACHSFDIPYFLEHMSVFTQLMFMLDTYLHLITAIKKKDVVIMTAKAIVSYRTKRIGFAVDLLSALPIGMLSRLVTLQRREAIYWDLLRLFKTWRAMKILVRMESNIKNPASMPWLRHTIVYVILIYWSSIIIYFLSCPRPGPCHDQGWVNLGKNILSKRGSGQVTRCFESYMVISMFYMMTATHQIHSSNIDTESLLEEAFICLFTAVIQTYVLYFTSHVVAVDQLSDLLQISFSSLMKNTVNFMNRRGIPKRLTEDLCEYLNLQWSHDRAHEYLLQKKLFYDAPEKLSAELSNYFKDVLKSYKIFQGNSEDTKYMIDKLADKARIVMLPKNFVICHSNTRASCLTILRKGYCRLISHLKADVANFPDGKLVGAGALFPLIEIVSQTASNLTAYTVTNCECIVIDEPDFIRAWESSENVRSKLVLNSPQAAMIIKTFGDEFEPQFHPQILDTRRTSLVRRKIFFCDKTNLFRVILHLCFPNYCFSPTGAFLFYWELSRFILIPFSINFFILYYLIFYTQYPLTSMVISLCFDTLSLIDIVFRLNTGYYNDDGVFVSDTCLVVYHYFVTAFVVDFFGAFPWQIIFNVKKVVDLPWLMLSLFKLLPMYRVIRFTMILAKRGTFKYTANLYNLVVVFITIINLLSCSTLLYHCFVEYIDNSFVKIYCKQQLLYRTDGFDYSKLGDVVIISFGALIGILLKMKSEIEQALNTFEMYICMGYGTAMNLLQIFFVMKCCRWAVSGLRDYTLYKQDVDNLDTYIKKNFTDVKIRSTIQNHFMYLWENRVPEEISVMFSKVHPTLRGKVLQHLYFDKLRLVSFLAGAHDYLLRALAQEIREMYVMKGQTIIEEFEVTRSVYLLWQGEVVVTVGKISPAVLGRGCVFGCLNHTGYNKHVFSFEVVKNAAILKIESLKFYSILKGDQKIYDTFIRLCLPSREYLVTGEEIPVDISSIDLTELDDTDLMTTSSSKYVLTYLIVTYFVAYLTLVLLCLFVTFGPTDFIIYSLLIVDLITLWKIFTQLFLPYIDPTSGFTVRNKKLIRKRYMKTLDFYIDVITFVPYVGIAELLVVKLLRVYEAVVKIRERRKSFISKNWEVWLHSILIFILFVFSLGVVWDIILGDTMQIHHYINGTVVTAPPTSIREQFLNSLLMTSVLLTQTGQIKNIEFPSRKSEIILGSIISLISLIVMGIFHGRLSHFVEKVTWGKRWYENKMQRQWQYLKLRDLSQCILENVWEHGEQLWHYSRGQYLPSALHVLPYPLKKKIMYGLFGRHLENSYLFKYTHIEFIKNLCARFVMIVFFPGETIVMEGDVDGTMYFIHSGEVDVLKIVRQDEEELVGILTVEQIFGFCQGLYECRPHPLTYRARSTCEILQLRREDWMDLMLFYDAQTLMVYKRASNLPYEFPINYDYLT